MVSEALHPFGESVPIQALDRLHDLGVQRAPALLQQTAVSHLLSEGVAKRVFEIGKKIHFIQEFGGLELGKTAAQLVLGLVGDRLEEHERHVLADDRRGLEHALVFR
jgi:hypothetical protein